MNFSRLLLSRYVPPKDLRWWFIKFVVLALGLCSNLQASAQFETKLKTAYIINIANFVSWPSHSEDINLCISEQSSLAGSLLEMQSFVLNSGQELNISSDLSDIENCQILFWDERSNKSHSDLTGSFHEELLIVSDMSDALERGFAIKLFLRNLKLRFSVNLPVVRSAPYQISSKLLRLSKRAN